MTRKQRLKNEAWARTVKRLEHALALSASYRPYPVMRPGQAPPKPYPLAGDLCRKGVRDE